MSPSLKWLLKPSLIPTATGVASVLIVIVMSSTELVDRPDVPLEKGSPPVKLSWEASQTNSVATPPSSAIPSSVGVPPPTVVCAPLSP